MHSAGSYDIVLSLQYNASVDPGDATFYEDLEDAVRISRRRLGYDINLHVHVE